MSWKSRFDNARERLLTDAAICKSNRDLFCEFFAFEEYKLKRQNGLPRLDDACYKTLSAYVSRFRNVNSWFENKPLRKISKADIKQVYDNLEDGHFLNQRGQPFADKKSYYNKIFKSKLFKLAGKDNIAREVIEFSSDVYGKEVRFLDEDGFQQLVSVLTRPEHLLLIWLAWDIGENINTLLRLRKKHFRRQQNSHTHDREYLVALPRALLKRSRKERSEPTLYPETVLYLDMVLDRLGDDDAVFSFGYRQALKMLKAAARRTGTRCHPTNSVPSWKDFRSGMACHLLQEGWTTDEVNFRLGHKPSSREIDVYVSYLAIDRAKPKKKLVDNSLLKVREELDEAKGRERVMAARLERQQTDSDLAKRQLTGMERELEEVQKALRHLRAR